MFKFLKLLFLFINVIIIITLLAIHFIFKEQSYQSSLLFYTFPLPVIIVITLLFSIFLKRPFKKYNIIVAALILVIWLSRSFKINITEAVGETDIEIVFWNASHDRNFEDAFIENKNIPDILVLVEHGEYNLETVKEKYPEYYFYKSIRGVSICSKTPLTVINEIGSKHSTNIISFKTININFYAIDVSASMDVPRTWELDFVDSQIKTQQNTILLGDFNVPFESKLLSNIKQDFKHALTEKGNGFRETWFWNIPLLSLDHIWVSKDLKIVKAEKISTFKSDHSIVKVIINR